MKVTLQTRAPENFRSRRWGAERRVLRALPGSEDPHRRERKFFLNCCLPYYGHLTFPERRKEEYAVRIMLEGEERDMRMEKRMLKSLAWS